VNSTSTTQHSTELLGITVLVQAILSHLASDHPELAHRTVCSLAAHRWSEM
jgi:hypothetical protein